VRTASKKSQILKKKKPKSQTIFLTPTTFKKTKYVKFGVKKANLATLLQAMNGDALCSSLKYVYYLTNAGLPEMIRLCQGSGTFLAKGAMKPTYF